MSYSTYRYGQARDAAGAVSSLCKHLHGDSALLCAALVNALERVHVLEEREARLAIYAVELSKRVEAIEYREDLK
jgi:hypothetical protein